MLPRPFFFFISGETAAVDRFPILAFSFFCRNLLPPLFFRFRCGAPPLSRSFPLTPAKYHCLFFFFLLVNLPPFSPFFSVPPQGGFPSDFKGLSSPLSFFGFSPSFAAFLCSDFPGFRYPPFFLQFLDDFLQILLPVCDFFFFAKNFPV